MAWSALSRACRISPAALSRVRRTSASVDVRSSAIELFHASGGLGGGVVRLLAVGAGGVAFGFGVAAALDLFGEEVLSGRRPLPVLPPPAVEACARALLAEAGEISWMTFPPAPYDHRPREEFQRALLTGACQAIRRGEQVTAVRQDSGGTWEAVDVRIPPVYPHEPDHVGTALDRRPALRLVAEGHQPPAPGPAREDMRWPARKP
jgi:hypothetical protein